MCALLVLGSLTALALGARDIRADGAAYRAPTGPRCVPAELNRSAVLPGTSLTVSPLPDSYDASQYTQISLLGAPAAALSEIAVSGSQTGAHGGRLLAYSQGDGASFVPSRPFREGETVTVRGRVGRGAAARPFAFHFTVAQQDYIRYAPTPKPTRDPGEEQHFHSRPELLPPVLAVSARSAQSAPGYIFAAPYAGPGPSGPMIFDEAGELVWFQPLPSGIEATNLQIQQYAGRPVLTWWQGQIPPQGFGRGEDVIANSSYQVIDRVHAGNGYEADLHEFHLTPQSTALLTVFDPIACNLSSIGGPSDGAVTDSIFQEVDLRTGLVRREWHGLDHVSLAESYSSPRGTSSEWPFDYLHINSVDPQPEGRTLVSARNTWTLYELNTLSGQVLSRIGGRHSTVKLGSGAATAFQHDASALSDGLISVFDNGATPAVHPQSRALLLSVVNGTATLLAGYEHPTPLSSGSQGSVQVLENGDVFVGWGAEPYFSEFSSGGQLLYDAHMHGSYQSYRAYRYQWTGAPSEAPAVAALPGGPAGGPTVYASWNGDTRTSAWRVLAGASAQQLAPVATASRTGFETAIATPAPEAYVAVQALDAEGAVIGTSPAIAG